MSKNNTINKSDKKFIRREKARIRTQFLDVKKQNELIDNLYKKFSTTPEIKEVKPEAAVTKKVEVIKTEKANPKKEKVAKKSKPKKS